MPPLVKTIPLKILAVISLLLFAATPSWGADIDKGMAAYLTYDGETAINEWTPLAEQGHVDAQFYLGMTYLNGRGVQSNRKTAIKWFTLAAEQGDANAQNHLGQIYDNGYGNVVPQDYKMAVKWYTLAAEQGHAYAQSSLGWMYLDGRGVIQNYVFAHMWVNISISNGSNSIGLRRMVARRVTAEQVAEAQALAHRCVKNNYKNCMP